MTNESGKACPGGRCVGAKVAIVVALIVAVGLVVWAKSGGRGISKPSPTPPAGDVPQARANDVTPQAGLPRLVDLGAGKCIPCKMMAPILEELKSEYEGRFEVQFIDVWENPDAAKEYGIRLIPTQVFFDASVKELFRHEGFFSKEDILAKWKELGFDFAASTSPTSAPKR